MGGGASEVLLRLLRGATALGLAIAVGGGVILVLEAVGPEQVQVLAGRGPGVVTVLGTETQGAFPFTEPFAVDLDLDPALLASAPRTAAAVESPHRRHSDADVLVASAVAPAMVAGADDPGDLRLRRIRAILDDAVGLRAVIDDLEDRDRDGFDDDSRFTLTALDGSSACVSVGAARYVTRSLGSAIDADGVPVSGVSWSPYGPCSAPQQPRSGSDVRAGTTPGTYGAVVGGEVCDVGVLRNRLAGDEMLARVWGAPLGIAPSDVFAFLDTLTPVVLLADTAVTDHELRGERVAARQAVLERGSAVLVDGYGTPVVRCMSGAPLRAAQRLPDGVRVDGDAWPGFSLDAVRRVPAGVRDVSTFVLVDVATGLPVRRVAGIDGMLTRLAGPVVTVGTG